MLTYKNNPRAVAFVALGDTGNAPPFHGMMTRFDSYTNECMFLFFFLYKSCIYHTTNIL